MMRFLITPVKNEAPLLETFIRHHTPLFDRIVIADQQSTDGSWEIANSHPNVIALQNDSAAYDEHRRRALMLEEVQRRHAGALVMGLDADEFLLAHPADWEKACRNWIENHSQKTIRFDWNYLLPNGTEWFVQQQDFCRPVLAGEIPPGFIHRPRIPLSEEKFHSPDFPILHLNLYWLRRMRMKVWWYLALEAAGGKKPSIDSLRLYSRNASLTMPNRQPVPEKFQPPVRKILDSLAVEDTWETWQKSELLKMLAADDRSHLSHTPIWSFPWNTELEAAGHTPHRGPSFRCLALDWWVSKTNAKKNTLPVRLADALLRRI
jgi:hypothetical protein